MLKRSALAGLVTGFFISLALIYPVGTTMSTRYIPDWQNPPATLHNVLQLAFLIAALSFFGMGAIATALLVRPRSSKMALRSGAIAGTSAMLVIQILIISPANGMSQMRDVLQIDPLSGPPTEEQMVEYASRVSGAAFSNVVTPLLFGLGIGALLLVGIFGVYHLLRYQRIPGNTSPRTLSTPPNLLHQVQSERAVRWPDPSESTWRAAIMSGLLVGLFMGLQALLDTSQALGVRSVDWEVFGVVTGPGLNLVISGLASLAPIVVNLGGVLVLALQRSPSSRYWSRVRACTIAGGVAGLVIQVTFLNHVLRISAPVLHLFIIAEDQTLQAARTDLLPYVPYIIALAFFGLPLVMLAAVTLGSMLVGFLEGLFYAWLVPLIPGLRRPVDVGQRAFGRMENNPTEVLPIIWELFQGSEALQALAHLAIRARNGKNQPVSEVAAAYHTAVTHPEAVNEAVQTIATVLADRSDWRWRAEIGELYRLLRAALEAHEVADIAIMPLPPEERTSSLPKPLTGALDHLAAIIRTLKKYERVDSLGGQILFLNNALDAIDRAREFVRPRVQDEVTAYPEQPALEEVLQRWQTLVLDTIRGLRGRAEMTVALETRRLPHSETLNLEVRLVNVGLNVAEDIGVQLVENEAYQAVPGHDYRGVEILLPGDGRSLEFSLKPTARPADDGKLGVAFDIKYNDSVDPQRHLELSDSVTFLDQLGPFQRIFPIPYVTGTPLRTSDMFVGRGDVLQFIREHLLGAYQNNVIVLHGQRRTGKTSILYQLQRNLLDSHVCVLVDMQGKAARGLVDFLYSLADDITYTLGEFDIELDLPDREAFEESPEFFFRARFLREATQTLGQRNLLLMFDEFEELQARVEASKLEPDIFPYLRNLMQHEQSVDFVFAGTHKLEELAAEYWSILFNIATYKRISFLTEEEVSQLITAPVAASGLSYDPLALRRIYSVTAGQPYFVQLVCHELVAYHNETERNYLTTYDVEKVLETIIERGEAHFKYIWSGATPRERWVLLGAAEHLAHAETITYAELAAWLRQQEEASLDSAALPDVLAALEQRDILTRTSPGSRRYRFKIDLVRRWILANRQLRESIGA